MLFGLLLIIGSDLLIAGLAIPLMRRRVRPNALYGLRVAATYADEHVWYEANAASARDLLYFAVAHIFFTLLAALIPDIAEDTLILGSIVIMLIGVITIAIVGWKRANRMLEQRKG